MSSSICKVLVVEPRESVRASLVTALEHMSLVVSTANDGPTAMKLLESETFQLVVSDLYVQYGVSRCVVHAIRHNTAYSRTPVLVHTGFSTRADQEWARKGGANGFLIRPARAERLEHVVGCLTARGTRLKSRHAADKAVS